MQIQALKGKQTLKGQPFVEMKDYRAGTFASLASVLISQTFTFRTRVVEFN